MLQRFAGMADRQSGMGRSGAFVQLAQNCLANFHQTLGIGAVDDAQRGCAVLRLAEIGGEVAGDDAVELSFDFGRLAVEQQYAGAIVRKGKGNVIGAVNTEAFRECIEYCYKLGQEGLINLEGFAQTLDQFNANLNADKVGVFWAWGPCNHIEDSELFLQFEPLVPLPAEGYETEMYTGNLDFANAYRNNFIITKNCENIEKAYELWEYASDPIRALEICNGSHRGIMWDFVDENNEYLPADATLEEIAANGFKYLPYVFETEEEENAALTAAGYDWLIGKTYTGSNTTGLVNIAPLMLESENYRTDDLTVWGAQRYASLDQYDEYLCPYYMNASVVSAEAQEELDFMTDGLDKIIKGFFAESVMNGITDESWNAYLNDLETYGYDYYIDFYNRKAHNEL